MADMDGICINPAGPVAVTYENILRHIGGLAGAATAAFTAEGFGSFAELSEGTRPQLKAVVSGTSVKKCICAIRMYGQTSAALSGCSLSRQ